MKPIKTDDKLHSDLVSFITSLVKISDDKLNERLSDWRIAEEMNQSYVPAADAERLQKRQNQSWMDSFTKITIPYCYGVQMAMHTYLASVFMGRSPVYQSGGRNGQGQDQILMMDALIDYQMMAGDMAVPHYMFLMDPLTYGVGVMGLYWDEELRSVTSYRDEPKMIGDIPVLDGNQQPETEKVEFVEEIEGYKGHKAFNVRPTDMLFDTRISLACYQQGEFLGRRMRKHENEIKSMEGRGYFNTEQACYAGNGSKDNDLQSENAAMIETSDQAVLGKRESKMINLKEMYIKLIPSKWGLGSNTREEMWRFTLAENTILIEARPAGWYHGMFPYIVQPLEYDAYSLSSRGIPQLGRPFNDTMDWLINSHMFNVKKAVNNEFIFDPSVISSRDFLDARPGKRIRLLPAGYGKDIRNMVHQLPQVDYTRQNLADIAIIEGLFQKVTGVTPQMMGSMQTGGRRSATEVRTQNAGGVSRLKVLAEFFSATSFSQAYRLLASGSRQMYDQEMTLRIAGNQGANNSVVQYTPNQLAGEFDFVPVDGTLPVDRMAMAAMYREILTSMGQMPSVAGRYDVAGIFAWTVKMAGIKNLDTFKIQPQDEQKIMDEVRRGNLVLSQEAMNGRGTPGTSGGVEEGSQGVQGTPTVSGMGPLG